MACYTMKLPAENPAERDKRINDALARVEAALAAGTAEVVINASGAAAIKGWTQDSRERGGAKLPDGRFVGGLTDVCALRQLLVHGSATAKSAIAAAEKKARVRFNPAAAVHSHDGGITWGSH